MEEKEKEKESEVKKEKSDSMKKGKLPIFKICSISIVAIIAIVAVVFLTGKKEEKITISFDTSGAKSISAVEIKKGDTVKLPDIEKEGFIFDGWYLNSKRVTSSTTFTKSETLKAKWISKDAKTFKVTFDSDGGSNVESIVVECGKELSLPTNPTKDGYSFVSWVDKNEKAILDKALLDCEDITLKANWKKEDKEDNKKADDKNKKAYKCPSGYTLSGTQCVSETSVTENCPSGYSWSTKVNKCVAKTTATAECPSGYQWSSSQSVCVTFTDQNKTCVYDSYAGAGAIYDDGYCYHGYDSVSKDQTMCEARGGVWHHGICSMKRTEPETSCPDGYSYKVGGYYGWSVQKLSKCAKESQKNIICPDGYRLYHSDPNFGAGDVCVKLSEQTKTCPDGYSLSGNVCRKTINATYE